MDLRGQQREEAAQRPVSSRGVRFSPLSEMGSSDVRPTVDAGSYKRAWQLADETECWSYSLAGLGWISDGGN